MSFGREERASNINTRRMNRSAMGALRGFGAFRIPFASRLGGGKLAGAFTPIDVSQRHGPYRYGLRVFFAENMCKAAIGPFRPYPHAFDKDDTLYRVRSGIM